MNDLKITNTLLLFIVVPLVFYLLKILSFIFVPLVLAMFIALLFLPLVRWFERRSMPRFVGIFFVVVIMVGVFKLGGELIQLTSNEIVSSDSQFFEKAKEKIIGQVVWVERFLGIQRMQGDSIIEHYFQQNNFMNSFGSTVDFISNTLSRTLTTAFFAILLLAESVNFQKILNRTIFKVKYSSVKTFVRIEKDILKFVVVKFVISLLTGVGFGLMCWMFGVSFPIFWGVFAFVINFIQMIGSVISVVALSLFAFVELDQTGTLLIFILAITGVQVLMGGIIEPVFMGKTFSLNVITVLIMLMLWGYIWGIPGLIMSIPITVFIKIVLDQFPKTKVIGELMSGGNSSVLFRTKTK